MQCDQYLKISVDSLKELLQIKRKQNGTFVHILRYLAKVSLQHCAVKSELERHKEAQTLAHLSFKSCSEALKLSYEMCKTEISIL